MDSATESSKNSRMKNEQSDFDVHYGGEILRGVIHERLRKRNEIQSTCCYSRMFSECTLLLIFVRSNEILVYYFL